MQGLFREQALEYRKQRLHGDVLLVPQLSHSLILSALLLWFIAVLAWLLTSNYSRKETVLGWLEPPTGVVRLYAESSGTIQKIFVNEGAHVEKDQPLMLVQSNASLRSGEKISEQLLEEFESQKKLISNQIASTEKIYEWRKRHIAKKIVAAQREFHMLDEQLNTLNQRYQLISAQVERFESLKPDGHVSITELDNSIGQKLALENDRQSLIRNQIIQKSIIEQLEAEQAILPDESANELALLRTKLSDVALEVTKLSGQNVSLIKAPRSGIVNNLQAREGQQLVTTSSMLLLTLIPHDSHLTAHLLIPVRSAGFVEKGQTLVIRYDAFPYQKFGLYEGEVELVSKTILLPNELQGSPINIQEPVYRVAAQLESPNVQAYGKYFPLKPGMTLSADIQLSDRTLIQWLLEPLYSLNGRL